jgi:ADP-ribosylglycohydrolase
MYYQPKHLQGPDLALPKGPSRIVGCTDQAKSVLFGAAIGDALGLPAEALDREAIFDYYGPKGIQELREDCGFYSDDTQMSLAVAQALVSLRTLEIDHFMENLGSEFVRWLKAPDSRIMGGACLQGIQSFEASRDWRTAGVPEALGNGSAMRVGPLGFFFQHARARLSEFAEASSSITHRSASAATAAIIAAHAVAAALDGASPQSIIGESLELCRSTCPVTHSKLVVVQDALRVGRNELETFDALGAGWRGSEAIALALYSCALRSDSYVETVRLAANHWGDSDTIASIAGGIQAARLGISSIPSEWLARIENFQIIDSTARELSVARQTLIPVV